MPDMPQKHDPDILTTISISEGFDPPPWNTYEHPEKTQGWNAYQEYLRKGK